LAKPGYRFSNTILLNASGKHPSLEIRTKKTRFSSSGFSKERFSVCSRNQECSHQKTFKTRGKKMHSINENTKIKDVKLTLSTLWIFATLNYLYCDILGFFDANILNKLLTGYMGSIQLTQGFLLASSVLMEIPISMIVLSRVLKYNVNRWANIIAAAVMTVVQTSSLFSGTTPTLYYIFFSLIEISCTLYIAWYAWKWVKQS
jgi:hypothetical protein